jgi:hypothetical protein
MRECEVGNHGPNQQFSWAADYLARSNHCRAAGLIRGAGASSQTLRASLEMNDGDDTYTVRYGAAPTAGLEAGPTSSAVRRGRFCAG